MKYVSDFQGHKVLISSLISIHLFLRVSPGQQPWLPQSSGTAWNGKPTVLQWKHTVCMCVCWCKPTAFHCMLLNCNYAAKVCRFSWFSSHSQNNFCLSFISRAAHSYWSKAVDCALQSSGAVEKWDGNDVTFGDSSCLQQTLKQAGIWGCLQAAALTAKIAQ